MRSPSGCLLLVVAVGLAAVAHAGGPRYVAGSTFFEPAAQGQPILWSGGTVNYFTDQGDLSGSVSNATAVATVDAAAAVWNSVPTAALQLTHAGTLVEDVSGSNVTATDGTVTMPADIQSTATDFPVGVIFDADGSVIDAFYGVDASDPDDCYDFGVVSIIDNIAPTGGIAHALILVNGRCTGTQAQLEQIEFGLIRAFGRVLGLDWSQANDSILSVSQTPSLQQLEGWPVMRPIDLNCHQLSTQCLPNPLSLRPDDIAAVSRLYPVTDENLARFPGKANTAAATISIHGTVRFRRGQGMQGVNVVARPITPGVGLANDAYPVACVSGFLFTGNQANPVNGETDSNGDLLSDFGSTDTSLEGYYDLSGIILPPGLSSADYQLTLEPVNPLYTGEQSVGPYVAGSPTPSGTMPTLTLTGLTAGASVEQDVTIDDSASDLQSGSGGNMASPASVAPTGEWQGRIASPAGASWFAFPVQAGRHLTVEAQALDEAGSPTETKLRPVMGLWNGSDAAASSPEVETLQPFNGAEVGVTSLAVDTANDGELLLATADARGDGRPDYVYHGRVLYAASVTPAWLPLSGGQIAIAGTGFRPGMTVMVGTTAATVNQITPTMILATAPSAAQPSGSMDLIIQDPATGGAAVIAAGISYGVATQDTISVVSAPPGTTVVGTSSLFEVRVFGSDQVTPIGGVSVTFSIPAGLGMFSECGSATCPVFTTGDGFAAAHFVAATAGTTKLQATLSNGAWVAVESTAVEQVALTALNPVLFLAPEASLEWTSQVSATSNSTPVSGALISWSGQGGAPTLSAASSTNAQGVATASFLLGPWSAGTSLSLNACWSSASACAATNIYVVHPQTEALIAVSGTQQTAQNGSAFTAIVARLVTAGNQPVAGGVVTLTAALRANQPACNAATLCPAGRSLGSITLQATSGLDGTVQFTPSLPAYQDFVVEGLLQAGSSSTLPVRLNTSP